jgi:ornithine cyclodeaminase
MRLLSESDVAQLISPEIAIAAAERAFSLQSSGSLPNPGRVDIRSTPDFRALVIAGLIEGPNFGLKTNMHGYASNLPRSTASFLTIWNVETCQPRAFIATSGFNDHRTAAGFAAAARALKGKKARTLTVFGAGKIAAPTIRYIAEFCPIEHVNIVALRPGRAEVLAETMRQMSFMKSITVSAALSHEEAAQGADIIVTITTSDTPVVFGEWVKPGALVILGGANRPGAREADDALITSAKIFVDHTDGCIEKAGDIRLPIQNNLLTRADIVGEIGSVFSGHLKCEDEADKIIVFKSIGLISQDLVLAEALLTRARQRNVGVFYDIQDGSIQKACEVMPA